MALWNDTLTDKDKKTIFTLFARHLSKGQTKTMRAAHLDFIETRRKGIGFTDGLFGRRIIDCFTSAGCFNVGRGNPEIIAALRQALQKYDIGTNLLQSNVKQEFIKKLKAIAPGDCTQVLFASGGGDAIDCAIKLARGATGRKKIIAMKKAYHGHTGYSLSANGKDYYRHLFEPLEPNFVFVQFGDLEQVQQIAGIDTAAIILEPVQGEGGIFVGDDYYLKGLRKICNKFGIMLIFDEIQTGFGRTGRMFASQHSGVVPDIMTLAKSISGGLFPNAVVMYRNIPLLAEYVKRNPEFHQSITGGSDIGCAVGIAVIDYIVKNRLWENAEKIGNVIMQGLENIQHANPDIIKEIRGKGLMIGVEYTHEYMGALMADSLARHGIFAVYSGNQPQVMRFMVPITITKDEALKMLSIIQKAIETMRVYLPLTKPLSKIPLLRVLLDDIHVQIAVFDIIRYFEDILGITKRNYSKEA
ncbi:MAG: aminotransferase class III-fold pyridoxal phosphate-dependent enzyme [Spirochaetes bacterium]|nr:aminotransferase class III-fold pyridoxal phosphate-dependent enzyme [Spirochaetota bacterium]